MLSPVRFDAKAAEPTEEYVAVEKETCVVSADEIGTANERLRLLPAPVIQSPEGLRPRAHRRSCLRSVASRKRTLSGSRYFLMFTIKNIDKSSLKKILFRFQAAGYLIYHYIITNYIFIHE